MKKGAPGGGGGLTTPHGGCGEGRGASRHPPHGFYNTNKYIHSQKCLFISHDRIMWTLFSFFKSFLFM